MTTGQPRPQYCYECTKYGRMDCDYRYETDDPEDLRTAVRDHVEQIHRPEDFDPNAIDALIVMQTVEP